MRDAVGKISLAGLFGNFCVRAFPGASSQAVVFARLLGGVGKCELSLEIRRLDDGAAVTRILAEEIVFHDRLAPSEVLIPLWPFKLERAGAYELVLLANGRQIESLRFTATLAG
jgi:hypothetical protein